MFGTSYPGDAARLTLSKAGALLSGYEVPNNRDLYLARRDSLLLSILAGRAGPFFWPWGLLVPLALFGLLAAADRRRLWWCWSLPILYGLSIIPFFVCDRFRLPLVPFLAIPAGAALAALPAFFRRPAWPRDPRRAAALGAAGVAFLLGLGARGTDTRVNPADAWHKLAEALYNRGEIERSLAAFDLAQRAAPADPAIALGRAWALQAAADTLADARLDSLAGAQFQAVAARLPDSWQAQYAAGLWLLRHGRPVEAIPPLEKAAGLSPERGELHRDLGFAYEEAGRWREAGLALNYALKLGESGADLHLSLGLCALQAGAPDMAENNWRRALELDANHFRSLYNLGLLRFGQGRDEEAADLWRRAARVAPQNPLPHWQLARLAARRGDGAAAGRHLEEARALGIDPRVLAADPLLGGLEAPPGGGP